MLYIALGTTLGFLSLGTYLWYKADLTNVSSAHLTPILNTTPSYKFTIRESNPFAGSNVNRYTVKSFDSDNYPPISSYYQKDLQGYSEIVKRIDETLKDFLQGRIIRQKRVVIQIQDFVCEFKVENGTEDECAVFAIDF